MARKIQFCVLVTKENQEWLRSETVRTGKSQTELFSAALDCLRTREALIPAIRAAIREELA